MTKFLLIVWIGAGQTQTLAIDHFDTSAECEAARAVLELKIDRKGWFVCEPYEVQP